MIVDAREGHSVWSAVYDDAPNPLLELERRTVLPWLPPLASETVIDVACGTGRWTRHAARQGALAFGVDFCRPMLARARSHVEARGARFSDCIETSLDEAGTSARAAVHFIEGDALRLPLRDACADLTICAFASGYLESPAQMIAELSRITRRGGHVLVADVHPAAIAAGWRRSFRYDGDVYEIEHRAHAIDNYLASASCHRLALTRMAEPPLGEPERPIFRQCGQEDRFASSCATTAIFAMLWRRI